MSKQALLEEETFIIHHCKEGPMSFPTNNGLLLAEVAVHMKCSLHTSVYLFQVTLSERHGQTYTDYSGQSWDQFAITPASTDYFRIDAVSVYTSGNNGFGEIEVYGFLCKYAAMYYITFWL